MARRFLLFPLVILLSACAGSAPTRDDTFAYQCDGASFRARFGPAQMDIWFDGQHYRLPQQRSGSGMRYGNDELTFAGKGREARLQVGELTYTGCITESSVTP